MKTHLYLKTVLFCLLIIAVVNSNAQQEFTLTTSPANITSSQALINLPELNGNPNAIIIATPQGNTATLNTHPLGAWYYSGKWYLFNTDFAPMLQGLTYKIKYYLISGTNEFLHLVTLQNLGADGSYIDNPVLNNKPNAQFAILQNHAPDIRSGSWRNPNEAKAAYNAATGKWYITNINGQPLQKGCAYNIVVTTGGTADPGSGGTTGNCTCPLSLPPNGMAGGDLAGNYPAPVVQKINGYPVSSMAPQTGEVLKWNGSSWSPAADENTGQNPVATNPPSSGIKVLEYFLSQNLTMKAAGNYDLPGLDRTINITSTSLVLATMSMEGYNFGCLACTGGSLYVRLNIDQMEEHKQLISLNAKSNNTDNFSVSSPIKTTLLSPGNHRFKVTALKLAGGDIELYRDVLGLGTRMTIIIIPQ